MGWNGGLKGKNLDIWCSFVILKKKIRKIFIPSSFEPARMAESYTAGNVREEGLQTISSDSGSILRVNRGYRDVGSYFLRAGTSRRK